MNPVPLLLALVLLTSASCQSMALPKPREADWKAVGEAMENDQPKTAIGLLESLQTAAYADQAWAEGVKAQAMRLVLAGEVAGGIQDSSKQLALELPAAPAAAQPVLRLLHAQWLLGYYQENRWEFMQRSATASAPGDEFETWDLGRMLTEIDRRFQAALADRDSLRQTPIATFDALFEKGDLGDELRPTLYDFLAHAALEFYALEETAAASPQDAFTFGTDSPAFGPVAAFLEWNPPSPDPNSPKLRALKLYQDLLTFHQADPDPTALLHCDLQRLRWAGEAATGPNKGTSLDLALRSFIETHAAHPLSAAARHVVASALDHAKHSLAAHEMAIAGAAAFPAHPYGKLCLTLVHKLEAKWLQLGCADHWTPAGEPLGLSHANLDHVWFRAYRRPWAPTAETIDADPAPADEADLARLLKGQPSRAWDAPLPDDRDFRQRTTTLPAPTDLPPGFYLIIASGNADFSIKNNQLSVRPVHVTRYAVAVRDSGGRDLTGLVTDAATGAPLPGVKVTAIQERSLLPGLARVSATSDADGWFSVKIKSKEASTLLVVGSDSDQAIIRPYLQRSSPAALSLQHLAFFTDRAIYRPGQTIQFKAIWCEADTRRSNYRTLPGKTAHISLRDPNKKEVAKLELTTNEHGSCSGTFTAPAGLNGGYTLAAGDLGSATIRIEEYKRPKFTVTLKAPVAPTALGAEVETTGVATAFTGAPVDGAKVTWHVSRSDCLSSFFINPWNGMRGFPMTGDTGRIAHGSAVTAADGSFPIRFTAAANPHVKPEAAVTYLYLITADVTDSAGETRSATTNVTVGTTTLRAGLSTDEWLEAAPRQAGFKVLTTTHTGEGRPAAGTLTIRRLKQPVLCARDEEDDILTPNGEISEIDPTDPDSWESGEVVTELPVQTRAEATTGHEVGTAEVSAPLPAGCYRGIFVTKDDNGRKVETATTFHVMDPAADRFPTRIPFLVTADRDEAEPGQPFTLLWGSGHPAARACVEWFKDGVLLKREWSAPGRTQQTFSLTPDETMRGGFSVQVTQTTLNRLQEFSDTITVPWSNKTLALRWEHLTSKLTPGASETWTAVITGPDGQAAPAEMVATLYDASLDAFAAHDFSDLNGYLRRDPQPFWDSTFSVETDDFDRMVTWPGQDDYDTNTPYRRFPDELEAQSPSFGAAACSPKPAYGIFGSGGTVGSGNILTAGLRSGDGAINRNSIDAILNNPARTAAPFDATGNYTEAWTEEWTPGVKPTAPAPPVTARRNLQETAFFYPHLTSNDKGEVRLTFTMPEALTTWRFLGFAHDRDMRSGTLEGKTVTAKDLMVQPNPPRFLREGDTLDFTVKVTNQSERPQSGTANLTLTDAATLKDATAALGVTAPEQSWTIPAKESRTLSWRLSVPDGTGFLNFKATATCGSLSDGEEGWLPVIPRRVLLTESMNLPIRDAGSKDFVFQKLLESGKSPTLEHRSVRLQVASQPAWYAVMALPYLMEFPHECAEQTFHRYYANALARHLATSNPKIRRVFDQWQATKGIDSPLTKNSDLTGIMLEETPWLAEAADPAQARHQLGLLFDANRLDHELDLALRKLREVQRSDGLWPWFPGGPGDSHITLCIATGFARLRASGVATDVTPALKALTKLDADLTARFTELRKQNQQATNHLDAAIAEYLYTRTLFLKDRQPDRADQAAFDFFTGQAKRHWAKLGSRLSRAHVALALARLGDTATAKLITRSLKEHSVNHPDTGMSWADPEADSSWYWWQAPVETQAMMIEAFREIDHDDQAVEACQTWLIAQKQVRDWRSTTATADAIHALLIGGRDWLDSAAPLQVTLGGAAIKPDAIEPGTGFYETRFTGPWVTPELGTIQLTKTDPGIAWAGIHWQYLEDLAKVTDHQSTGLKLEKSLFVRTQAPQGPKLEPVTGPVRVGDELVTRLVLRNDRAMEYVHLKDQRGSGTEPVNVLSGYRWQDGFGYYEVTRDTASHFFIDTLPAGTHVFETSVRIQHAGTYQTGLAEIRCMYAPAFAAHSGSVVIRVE